MSQILRDYLKKEGRFKRTLRSKICGIFDTVIHEGVLGELVRK